MGFVCVLPMAAAELIQLATVGEDNKGNLSITEDREMIRSLVQTIQKIDRAKNPSRTSLN